MSWVRPRKGYVTEVMDLTAFDYRPFGKYQSDFDSLRLKQNGRRFS